MKRFLLIVFIFLNVLSIRITAKKKMKAAPSSYIRCEDATFSYIENHRKVGNVYEFLIRTYTSQIMIDSVWFGATPVPCDIYTIKTRQRLERTGNAGRYLVKANRDLYANYSSTIDSSEASAGFVPPFAFRGTAYIMYKVNRKRYYQKVHNARKVAAKPMR